MMNCALLNARSVCNKLHVLHEFIVKAGIDVMCLTESWLPKNDQIELNLLVPPGYKFVKENRENGSGGGIIMIYKQQIDIKQVKHCVKYSSFESLRVHLKYQNILYNIHLVYRPPPSETNKLTVTLFKQEFSDFLENICLEGGRLLVLGDFNFHVELTSCPLNRILEANNLEQLVEGPTHEDGHTLDLLITRKGEALHVPFVKVGPQYYSDHSAIHFNLGLPKPLPIKETVTYRKTKTMDMQRFKEFINEDKLCSQVIEAKGVNAKLNVFYDGLTTLLDKMAPLKQATVVKRHKNEWYNDEIRQAKQKRRKMERRWKHSKLAADKELYKTAKIETNRLISEAKGDHLKKSILDKKGNQKELFKIIAGLQKTSSASDDLPTHQSESELCEQFNAFFTGKVEKIRNQIDEEYPDGAEDSENAENDTSHSSVDSVQVEEVNSDGADNEQSKNDTPTYLADFTHVDLDEMIGLINSMPNKSCTLDPVPSWLIKSCASELSPAICSIVNTSLKDTDLPNTLKKAVVVPLKKKPSLGNDELKNYRPVSNLNFISKVVEKVVRDKLLHHIQRIEGCTKFQSAYKKAHSTETALVRVVNDIANGVNEKKCVTLVLLDLSAAFDTIDQQLLIHRLEKQFMISGKALDWMKSYLFDRTQVVSIGNAESIETKLKYGVPQGSILGPLLFTLYTAPLCDIISGHSLQFHLYADDTQIYVPIPFDSQENSISKLETCIKSVKEWMGANKLKINDEKTELITFSSRQTMHKVSVKSIVVGNKEIEACKSVRNLGFHLDQTLSLDDHINKVKQKCFLSIRNIHKLRRYLDEETTRILVQAFVTSHLDYCNALFYGLPSSQISHLQKIQNRCARVITRAKTRDHVTPLLIALHWLPIEQRCTFKIATLVFKAMHGMAPDYLAELIEPYVPARPLRSEEKNQLVSRFSRTVFGEKAFSFHGPKVWNSLPLSIRNSPSLESFKSKLKTHLFREAFIGRL